MKDAQARRRAGFARLDAISRNNPFDAIKTKMAALQPVILGILGDSTTRDSSPNDGTPERYPALFQEDLVARSEIPAAYTVRRIVWDSTLQKPVWGSTPIIQVGSGWTPSTVTGSVSGTTFTLASGSVSVGQIIAGPGLVYGTFISSGAGSTWTLSEAPSAAISTTTFYVWAYNAPPPLPWDMWQASVTGSIPNYFMGNLFGRALASVAFDALIFAHGINTAPFYQATTPWDSQPTKFAKITGVMVAAIEQFRTVNPNCPVLMLTQHPLQSGTPDQTGDASWRPAVIQTAQMLGCAVDDSVFAAYNAAGKPSSLYNGDGIHQSTGTGNALYVAMLRNNWWVKAVAILPSRMRPSLFQTQAGAQNLLTNSAWEKWTTTTAAPDGWTAVGSPTISQDTTNFADPRKGYSCYVVAPAGTAAVYLQQAVPNAVNYRGRTVTLIARAMIDTGGSNIDLARIGIIATSNAGSVVSFLSHGASSTITQAGGFRWIVLTVTLPDDLTALTVRVYSNISGTSDGTRGVRWDQVCLVPGSLPLAARV